MNLKIKPEHFENIRDYISVLLKNRPDLITLYEHGNFARSESVKDLNKRFRWDMLWYTTNAQWVCDTLYTYLDDTHLDSALKQIVPTIEKKY